MGVVYRARDPLLNRDVAVKCVPRTAHPGGGAALPARGAARGADGPPRDRAIYDFGRHEGALYFVMPLVQGANLRAFLRQAGAALGDIVDIGIQVAEALEYSHARGVVHRDIKPENIMVAREEGGGVRVRVMDFGLARATSESRHDATAARCWARSAT